MKIIKIVMLLIMIIVVSCGNNEISGTITKDITVEEGEELTIKGNVIITNGAVVKMEPGSKMNFIDIIHKTIQGDVSEAAYISFENGSYIIAEGTKDKIIEFYSSEDAGGAICIKESANGDKCSFKYCWFNGNRYGISLSIIGSTLIEKCKFVNSSVGIDGGGSFIKNNTFINGGCGTYEPGYSYPIISYNIIQGEKYTYGLHIAINDTPIIKYNNITDINWFAIANAGETITILYNYVYNCNQQNGFSGIDTTGVQSWKVKYDSPLLEPVAEAGCGW